MRRTLSILTIARRSSLSRVVDRARGRRHGPASPGPTPLRLSAPGLGGLPPAVVNRWSYWSTACPVPERGLRARSGDCNGCRRATGRGAHGPGVAGARIPAHALERVRCCIPGPAVTGAREQKRQPSSVDWLDNVLVETRFLGVLPVLGLTVARQRDEIDPRAIGRGSDAARHRVAIKARHPPRRAGPHPV